MAEEFLKLTATSLFITPILKLNIKKLWKLGFENAYIKDEVKDLDYKQGVYLLFRPMNLIEFNEFVEEEKERKFLIDEYDYRDGYIMLVYKYHEEWQEDIDIILTGKFSEVSETFKREIPRKTGVSGNTVMSIQHHVFAKTQWLKNYWKHKYDLDITDLDEHWHFYPEKEIFTQGTLDKLTNF